jgi:Protein of unknown function (DUF1553)/Protein of unknown function (DUF1549)/Domain of unknown function (DUF4375)/Concanavalin A-like lectin/glucanases superfamily/Planctomycete cytochrome C
MPERQWLDGYNGETVDELIALEGKYRTDSLVLAFEQAMDQKAAREGDDKLTNEERVILAIEALEREVNNGGYGQFFVNSSREYAPIIVDALRRIGCPKTAEITQTAMKVVQKTPMTDEEIENGTWEEDEERQESLGECDTLYFERPESIEESLFEFIKANRAQNRTITDGRSRPGPPYWYSTLQSHCTRPGSVALAMESSLSDFGQGPNMYRRFLAIVIVALVASRAVADAPVDFSRDVRPILAQHCWTCHGPDEKTREAELRLDLRDNALTRKAIIPGDLKASKLVARIAADDRKRMPPPAANKDLNDRQKQVLRAWIEQGAPYSQHWAFVPPKRPAVPAVRDPLAVRNAIDAFVLQRLDREGLKQSLEADRGTILRRVTLDLTGLPPTAAEVDAFLADKSPDAYERLVERLLASPRYAERMALGWLDAARFADTNGFNNDEDRTQWPWRDWLIGVFAANMPYDRFVVEQLAGDLIPGATPDQKLATAFLRNQVHNTEGGIIPEEYRVEYVADRVHTTATVFLGLSMQCARCHDHKYDPFTQKEYYQFFGFFNQVSDKQASYSNFIGAEPFIRVPSIDQQARQRQLSERMAQLDLKLKQRETDAVAAIPQWEKNLTAEDRKKLAGAGLLLRIPLDETKGAVVATSDAAIMGTVKGNAKWGPGKVGGSLEFDGSTYVDLGAGPAFNPDGPFSVSIWAYPAANDLLALVSKMDDGAAHRGFDVLFEAGKFSSHLVNQWPDNGLKVLTKKAFAINEWHHVLVTSDGSKKAAGVKMYVDGKLEPVDATNDTLRDTLRTEKPLHIGRRGASLNFKGKLDDVQLFGVELTAENAVQLAAGKTPELTVSVLAVAPDRRTPAQQEHVRRFYLEHVDAEYSKVKAELASVRKQLGDLEKSFPAVMVMEELPKRRDTFVLKRGQYDAVGEKVVAGVPAVFPALSVANASGSVDRLDLAKWLVDPVHPLTARVAVNRWWEMYFGTGLVKTVEDFGNTGEAPSHPDLLDFLATELIRTGWDVKAMQRLIVTSATYRQDSRATKAAIERNPENRLLARGPRSRLRAETVRDNALAIAGLLAERVGGPSVKPYQPAGLWEDVTVERRGRYVPETGAGLYRRSMYTFWKRTCPPPAMATFDAPNREVCVARRATTNTPLQALVLMNDPTYVEAARKLAERMMLERDRLAFAFKCAVARPPTETEQRILMRLYTDALARFQADPAAAKKLLAVGESARATWTNNAELAAWTTVASTILNLDETISKR